LFFVKDSERAMSILQALMCTCGSTMWHENVDGLLVLLESFTSDLKLKMVIILWTVCSCIF